MATIGQHAPANFKHIIVNNGAHDSVGGQPTDAGNHEQFNFGAIAKGCGYREVGALEIRINALFSSIKLLQIFLL